MGSWSYIFYISSSYVTDFAKKFEAVQRRTQTRRPYLGWAIWFQRKYLVHCFKRSKISLLVKCLRFGLFCKLLGDIWVYWGINSFSQRRNAIFGNRKFWRSDVLLKIEFEVTNWLTYIKQLPTNLGCPFGGVQLCGGVSTDVFFSF